MITIADSSVVYAISRENEAVARCKPGDTIRFETKDCFSNNIKSETDLFESVGWSTINPATGPLHVEGAAPGDTLAVTVLDIEVNPRGSMVAVPGLGALGGMIEKSVTRIIPIKDGKAIFSNTLSIPIDPMIGVIGVAPEGEPVPCGTPGPHGGNMDTRVIRKGATVLLPVVMEGAMLCIGDLHAVMGDGEIVVCGVEVPGAVTIRVDVIKSVKVPCPVVEDKDNSYFVYSAQDLDEASQGALVCAVTHITRCSGMSVTDAGLLLSLVGHLEISQVVDPLKTARLRLPAWVGDKLGARFT